MFYKKVDYKSDKECFEFLANHYTYWTLAPWNIFCSIANNVKLWGLPVNYEEAKKALEEDDYFTINQTIRDWEDKHPGTEVYFNGKSGGYLVLKSSTSNRHIFDSDICTPSKYKNYEDWKQVVQDEWGSLKAYHSRLDEEVKLVQDFDKLCDDLLDVLRCLINDMKNRKARTHKYKANLRFQRYYYDNKKDLYLHMADMKQRGYQVWEYDDDDLFAEYEMNEEIESEVTLEEGEVLPEYENNQD